MIKMIRDRGRIKWTAMMLPEHVKMLRDWAEEDLWESPKELDEQQLEEFNEKVQVAKAMNRKVIIQYYVGHHYKTINGNIRSFDTLQNDIQVVNEEGDIHSIPLAAITDIEYME
ncbi:YolD-like family protein [Caldifermentibacillus hisashii]|uniref:YolD-like family protein n=1 Tax=Caldifermentibacillus hisashii TaxID=996558 RepID=UPI002E1BBFB5|nr:YolD-like family protein [Caldifermentibacillus hisashii]